MLQLGSALFLLVVQITSLIQCQTGPFHATVDDFGQAYWVNSDGLATELGEKMDSQFTSYVLNTAPFDAEYIAIAAANQYPPGWQNVNPIYSNPAWVMLSSDPGVAGKRIVTDTTWKCKAYPLYNPGTGIDQRSWPNSPGVITAIDDLVSDFTNLMDATEVSGNFPYFVPRIQLGAKRIWYAGLNEDDTSSEKGINPTNNVICLKKLSA